MKVLLAGGSGALGRRLSAAFAARGHEVVVLSRGTTASPYRTVRWDGVSPGAWTAELAGSAVVNLAGELVDRRPTAANVALLTQSRVGPTRALAAAAASLDQPVPVWLQASTMAIYGDAREAVLTEESPVASARLRWPGCRGPGKTPRTASMPTAPSWRGRASCWTATPRPWTA